MLNQWFRLFGLFAVLFALTAQLELGAIVPHIDPLAAAMAPCHADDNTDHTPTHAPAHSPDCLICTLCGTLHVQSAVPVAETAILIPPGVAAIIRPESPPPSTAPPAPHRPPSQPRAPPIFS